jgi:hypothetical protein
MSVELKSESGGMAPWEKRLTGGGKGRGAGVKRLGALPEARHKEDGQGARRGKVDRGGERGVLPRPLKERSKHQSLAVVENGRVKDQRRRNVTDRRLEEEVNAMFR